VKRYIFIGSSSEALEKARHIREILSHDDDVQAVLWTDVFDPGSLTLEALEDMLRKCCAAVFIASPDDETILRDQTIRTPRANTMLEFGLVAGRLGHHSVAICQYGKSQLPSDLAGLTVIRMEAADGDPNPGVFEANARDKLRVWSSRLLATAAGIPRTDIVHGYTGRWNFEIYLHTWRDLQITSPGYAHVKGYLDLFLPANGQIGRGLAHGQLQFNLLGKSQADAPYVGGFRTAHEIISAVGNKDGSLELTTEAFALQKIQTSGTPPPELSGMDLWPEPWSARWILTPSNDLTLSGTVRSQGGIVTDGKVTATKDPVLS
jgi:Predicted nucleotide-binding protein containing TIR-like domain